MPKELNGSSDQMLNDLSDWVLSHWFPTRKNFNASVVRKTKQ